MTLNLSCCSSWKGISSQEIIMNQIPCSCRKSDETFYCSCVASLYVSITVRQRSCGKVMLSAVSVRHSVHRGPNVAITDGTLDLTAQPSRPPPHQTSDMRPPWPWPPANDIWLPSLETCSTIFICGPPQLLPTLHPPPLRRNTWLWPLHHVQFARK